ncbi:MAG: signal peptidase I [Rickettsiales bacterium]
MTEEKKKESTWGMIRSFGYAVLLALVFRSLAYEPFHIPSGSMLPTMQIGDYIFVSKTSYGYGRYSFPFGTVFDYFDGRVMEETPKRGDVIVFRLPNNTSIDYIKRIIGLPGDKIQVIDGVLHINGKAVKLERIEDYNEKQEDGSVKSVRRYMETLPNGVKQMVLDERPFGNIDVNDPTGFDSDNTGVYEVPAGHYFFMGDNRDNSEDSRYMETGPGYVPAENLIGRADVIFVSFNTQARFWEFWNWINHDRWVTYVN